MFQKPNKQKCKHVLCIRISLINRLQILFKIRFIFCICIHFTQEQVDLLLFNFMQNSHKSSDGGKQGGLFMIRNEMETYMHDV